MKNVGIWDWEIRLPALPDAVTRISSNIRAAVIRIFTIDLRSLAIFRMGIALCGLVDLAIRLPDLEAHYADTGIISRATALLMDPDPYHFSLHYISGSIGFQAALFLAHATCFFLLLIGYKTRLAAFLSWLLTVSLQNRAGYVLQGGDGFFRMLLFWAMLLPLGSKFSVDSNKKTVHENSVCSFATAGILLQVAFVYWFSALLKNGPDWHKDGTAVYFALHVDELTRSAGIWLRQFQGLTHVLTHAVFYFEALGPFLLFIFFKNAIFRVAGIIGFWLLQVGFAIFLVLGPFPWVASVAMLPFIPTELWQKVFPEMAQRKSYVPMGFFHNTAAAICLMSALMWNLFRTPVLVNRFEPGSNVLARTLRLDQYWSMFSPIPPHRDGWYVTPGFLTDGSPADALHFVEGPVSMERPKLLSDQYPNERWRKSMMIWSDGGMQQMGLHLGGYLCRQWNRETRPRDRWLQSFDIVYFSEETLLGNKKAPAQKHVFWHQKCY